MNVRLYFNHLDICFGVLYSGESDFVDPIGHSHLAEIACGWGDYKLPWAYNPLNREAAWLTCFARIEKVER